MKEYTAEEWNKLKDLEEIAKNYLDDWEYNAETKINYAFGYPKNSEEIVTVLNSLGIRYEEIVKAIDIFLAIKNMVDDEY